MDLCSPLVPLTECEPYERTKFRDVRTDKIRDGLDVDVELVPETLHVCYTIESWTGNVRGAI